MRLFLAIVLTCYSIISYFTERSYIGDWANWNHALGAIILIWYLVVSYKAHREVILTGFFQIYYSIGMLLSAALVSGGMYMFEIAEFGDQNGTFWVMMTYFVSGLEVNRFGYRLSRFFRFGGNVKKLSRRTSTSVILFITTTTLVISTYVFISYRGPVLNGIDRVTFWREFVPSYLSFTPTLVIQSFFFVAFYCLWSWRIEKKSKLPVFILISYVLVGIFVLGEKLSLFLTFMTVWFALLPGVFPDFVIRRTHIIALIGVLFFLVTSVLVSYMLQDKDSGFALARVALQAQVLWSVFNDAQAHNFWSNDWSCYFGCNQFSDGKNWIAYQYLPFNLYNFYTDGGTTLSGFMPALSIMTMGVVMSLLLHLSISFVLGVFQQKILNAVAEENILYTLLLYKAHLSLTFIWFAAMQTAIPGLIVVLLSIGVYRVCFPVTTAKKRWANVHGALVR